jgi:hypothetical protein
MRFWVLCIVFALFLPSVQARSEDPLTRLDQLAQQVSNLAQRLSDQQALLQAQADEIERLRALLREAEPADAVAADLPAAEPESAPEKGTDLKITLGGFAQIEGLFDDGAMGSRDFFIARSIEDGDGRARSRFHAKHSRLRAVATGHYSGLDYRVFIDADFRGRNGNEFITNSSTFRIRNAYGQLGGFKLGQFRSAFVDEKAFPTVIDLAAPAGHMITRQAGVQYQRDSHNGTWAIALENPETDFYTLPDDAPDPFDETPDLTGFYRSNQDWGHWQLAGLVRRLSSEAQDVVAQAWGAGLSLSGRWLPQDDAKHSVKFSITGGSGISRYFRELGGGGYDAVFDPAKQDLDLLESGGFNLTYEHWWNANLRSNLAFGSLWLESNSILAADEPSQLSSGVANLFWNPIQPVTLGAEAQFGRRESQERKSREALRFHLFARYRF